MKQENISFWIVGNLMFIVKLKMVRFCICIIYEVNLNTCSFLEILNNVLEETVNSLPINETTVAWYQHDEAPSHNGGNIAQILEEIFDSKWKPNNGPCCCPLHSIDLNPMDFFIWGYIKNIVFKSKYKFKIT